MIETGKVIRLNANENFYGCSPYALEAIKAHIPDVHYYPDYFQNELREKLAAKWNVKPANIILGVGSVGIIEIIIRSIVEPDEEIITFERSFVAYGQFASLYKRKIHFTPLTNFACIPDDTLQFVNAKTKAIFIVNPNNPTGTMFDHETFHAYLKKIPSNILVAIDEAYYEYVTRKDFPDSLQLLNEFPNLIILRGFSKAYGLGGLRIGYAIASAEIAEKINSYRLPFSINSLAAPACIAAIDDQKFINDCISKNETERNFLFNELSNLGLITFPSHANFMFIYFEDELIKNDVHHYLLKNGISVCNLSVFGQSNSIRTGVADRQVNTRIIDLLMSFFRK